MTVTDEQRQQWQDLVRRSVAARVADDREAYRVLQAQRRDLIARLGPERVEVLRAESHQKAMQTLEQRRERQIQDQLERLERLRLTSRWQARPHSRLTDTDLTRAIRHAERQQAEHQATAERLRQQLAEREPAVAAGHGPRVTQLDTELHRLRVNAERQGTVEEIERRWQQLRVQAADAAERATHKQFTAERTRWWQPGRREQLQAEATADKVLSERLHAEAAELARPAGELQRQLGGPSAWRQARPQLERAEASYERDREHGFQADQNDLVRLRDRVTSQDTAAVDASIRRDELVAEQQLRAGMPESQRSLEHQLRTQAIEQQQLQEQATLERQREQSTQMDLDYHQRSIQADIHRGIDRGGPSL